MASLTPLAKANPVSKPEVHGLVQGGQQITESNNTGNTDGVEKIQHTISADLDFQSQLDPGKHRHVCLIIPHSLGDVDGG